ncbi:MAG: hypothetical protein IPG92_11695 [Flavobacteriales bacterium]|nr:hypothetical protein [Flavobacteriales bacterium]
MGHFLRSPPRVISILVVVTQSTSGTTCQEGGSGDCVEPPGLWSFQVACTAGCEAPTGSIAANPTCPGVDVTVATQGDGGPASIRYSVNGNPPITLPGTFTSGQTTTISPFAPGDQVVVTLLHGDQIDCSTSNTTLVPAPFVIPAYPSLPNLLVTATPPTVCSGSNSQLNVASYDPATLRTRWSLAPERAQHWFAMAGATQRIGTGIDDTDPVFPDRLHLPLQQREPHRLRCNP